MTRPQIGFTLLELLVTLVILVIGLSLAVPALQDYLLNMRQRAAVTALQSDLQFARGQAVHRNTHVVACPRATGSRCLDRPEWELGWLVFEDRNGDREHQPAEALLRDAGPVEHLDVRSAAARGRLRFLPSGAAPGSNATITFCDRRGATRARALVLSNTGRVRRVAPPDNAGLECA